MNEDKYKNYELHYESVKLPVNKYKMPSKVEDWINLQYSNEFLEKVKKMEDYSFMSIYIFEKAEMTYEYADMVNNILEECGLQTHMIVFLVFMKFLAKEIIQSSLLTLVVDLKYSRVLSQLNFKEVSTKIYKESGVTQFKIKDNAFLLQQSRNQKVTINNTEVQQQQVQPHLIK